MKTLRRPAVLLVEPIHPRFMRMLERRCRVVRPRGCSEGALAAAARGADAILIRSRGALSARVIAAAPGLKVIARHGVGLDHIDLPAATRAGVQVVYTPAGSVTAVAEHTWTMILALAKHARLGDRAVRAGDFAFRARQESLQLSGKTLGILGLGRIGSAVAAIGARAFHMRILYTDLLAFPVQERRLKARKVSLGRLLSASDVLSIHVPLTEMTRGMIGARELARMKPAALLINCARGEIVDAKALARVLQAERLGGAGIDVFDPEIPPKSHPLMTCERALLSPHYAAQTPEARLNYAAVVLDLLRVLKGQKPRYPAN